MNATMPYVIMVAGIPVFGIAVFHPKRKTVPMR